MTSPWVMFLLLMVFSFVLAAVLSCYREDEKSEILRGILRRSMLFSVSVIGFAAFAYFVSGVVLFPI
ncbi:MAG: hypothetical protein ACYTEP_02790 [Planctomycetota bacterium]|jgi:hypothetical protein